MTSLPSFPHDPALTRPASRRRPVTALMLFLAGLALTAVVAPAAGASSTEPTMSISPGIADIGQQLVVSVAGWPTGSASATVCGNSARGDDDCDQGGTRVLTVGDDGSGTTPLVAAPPVGCPCVVRVSTPSGDLVQTLPLEVTAAAGAPGGPAGTVRQLEVTARVLPAGVTWRSAFGAGADRKLELTIRNTGTAPLDGLALEAAVGRSDSSGRALASPAIEGALRPGEQRIVVVPFELTPPVGGAYVASGRVIGLDAPVEFRATTESQPWALAALVLAAGLGTLGWWIGARRGGRHEGFPAAPRDAQMARGWRSDEL